ncbi:3-oxoadipate enol-lactonase [Microbaculum marinisediminis]|uniref:3-oxoadipate enol-lactonase n=1 Tax=Microbaculum marinisediminis TaxID=2931392 RepID=A0AAW5QZ64_9HYPH|nr:3-oxoadipate enol-lactonase [Microbaculum sp. A6E488]MCT8972864.1 3-oxoadipate enol-lactonase [Microbaculum sp. A6E488]
MPETAANGATIHYEISGSPDGPWLVFSNSLGTDLRMWDAQTAMFGRDFRILRYDTRGHGQSDAPSGDYSFDDLGRDALAVMDAAGVDEAYFCGLSMGGVTGMWLGVNAPERFEKLVLCNTGAKIGDIETWQQRIDTVLSTGMAPLVEPVVDRWFTRRFQDEQPAAVDRIRAMIKATPGAGYAGCCAALRDIDLRDAIAAIDLPTLVVAGRHDPSTPVANAEEIHAAIKGSRLVVLDAAHLSNIEQEAEFNETVSTFLKA